MVAVAQNAQVTVTTASNAISTRCVPNSGSTLRAQVRQVRERRRGQPDHGRHDEGVVRKVPDQRKREQADHSEHQYGGSHPGGSSYGDSRRMDRLVQQQTTDGEQGDDEQRDEEWLRTAHHVVLRTQADRVDVDPEVLVLRS